MELAAGAETTVEELHAWATEHVNERAAHPRYIELMAEIPKTAVGKIFKPDLRKSAIRRIHGEALSAAGIEATIEVIEDKKLGLVSVVTPASEVPEAKIKDVLGVFPQPVRVNSSAPAMA